MASQEEGTREWDKAQERLSRTAGNAGMASATCPGEERREAPSALYHLGISALGHEGPPAAQLDRGDRCVNKPE